MTMKALGLIEAIGLSTAITAADAAVKSANVELLGYENVKGGGRISIKLLGDVGAVQAAIAAAVAAGSRVGEIAATQCIARPHDEIAALVRTFDRGRKSPEPERPAATVPEPVSGQVSEETVKGVEPVDPVEKSSGPGGHGKPQKGRK